MSVDKLVDSTQLDSDLTSVANAIRTRGGTSADLAFPAGFISAVGAIGNQYAASDEGKVVSNGELVAQTSDTVTQNGTVDTTLINSLTVNVSGGGGAALTFHTGTFTPATNTTNMEITGLGAPPMIIRFGVTENAADGVSKITAGVYGGGAYAMSRTNSGGATSNTSAYSPSPDNVFQNRTVYNDGSAPTTANRIFVTKTGFVVRAQNVTYGFKAGYTYKWECYTYPES